jgi:hypothetical protein
MDTGGVIKITASAGNLIPAHSQSLIIIIIYLLLTCSNQSYMANYRDSVGNMREHSLNNKPQTKRHRKEIIRTGHIRYNRLK